ncbi:hypothetical protein AX15_003821 [Amanita polypyramis BW_CC]|nr:hypothetical protein AX15_003821 [Amanita polypyramis BW_CC]
MNNPPSSYYFRRRTIGRAASPPTWACYEQIPYDDDDYSDSCSDDSCSEDDDEYPRSVAPIRDEPVSPGTDTDDNNNKDNRDNDDDHEDHGDDRSSVHGQGNGVVAPGDADAGGATMDMDEDHAEDPESGIRHRSLSSGEPQKDLKGKQKAADPDPEDGRRNRKKHHRPVYTLRPILTIHKSQGFVWNQDLFVPPYIKDRYVASTSPPNSKGFVSSSALSTTSGLPDYEVEVVEIRVNEGDLDGIIP